MKTARKTLLTACLVACAFACAGCGSKSKTKIKVITPTASAATVSIVEQTGEGARLLVSLELTNPNAIALPLHKAVYTVTVAGVAAGAGGAGGAVTMEDVTSLTLPANGTQQLKYPLASVTDGQGLAGAWYTVSGTVEYEPPGEVRKLLTESGVSLPKVRFSGAGEL